MDRTIGSMGLRDDGSSSWGQQGRCDRPISDLSWYHRQFREYLSRPSARLMIIGYSFGDPHINGAIATAVDQGTLRRFIIDPLGVDVVDKRNPRLALRIPEAYVEKLAPRIIGASRRPLSSTFGNDNVEHSRVMRFFAP
jgi:hypothetical protein